VRNPFSSARWRASAMSKTEPNSLTVDDREILDAYVGGELERRANEKDAAPSPSEGNAE
jgi:hypothetical protein